MTSVVVIKAVGMELHFLALIALRVSAGLLTILGLGFTFAVLLHVTNWAGVDGIAKLAEATCG